MATRFLQYSHHHLADDYDSYENVSSVLISITDYPVIVEIAAVGGTGGDAMQGRGGNDIYIVDSFSDLVLESCGQGSDLVSPAFPSPSLTTSKSRP